MNNEEIFLEFTRDYCEQEGYRKPKDYDKAVDKAIWIIKKEFEKPIASYDANLMIKYDGKVDINELANSAIDSKDQGDFSEYSYEYLPTFYKDLTGYMRGNHLPQEIHDEIEGIEHDLMESYMAECLYEALCEHDSKQIDLAYQA